MLDDLPQPVRRHLEREVLERALVAWFEIDEEGCVLSHGSSEADLTANLSIGDPLEEHLPVVVGLLPLAGQRLTVRSVEFEDKYYVDIHAFSEDARTWVLLVDEGARRKVFEKLLQRMNARELEVTRRDAMAERLAEVAAAFDVALFEPLGGHALRLIAPAPYWLRATLRDVAPGSRVDAGDISDFVEDFVDSGPWSNALVDPVRSLPWFEDGVGVGPMVRECVAGITASARPFLAVRRLGKDISDRIAPIQSGRDLGLLYEQLAQEIEEKDTLLHCIIHDLATPMVNVLSALELVEEEGGLSSEQRSLIDTARVEARRQRSLIHTILQVFRDERDPSQPSTSVDVVELRQTVESLRPGIEAASEVRGIRFRLEAPATPTWVAADTVRLQRVVQNLVENALRVGPRGTEVVVRLETGGNRATVKVDDAGPGVPDTARPHLFDKLRSSGFVGGKLGLGLYFCRITVERWGGTIEQTNLVPFGCRLQFSVPLARPPEDRVIPFARPSSR